MRSPSRSQAARSCASVACSGNAASSSRSSSAERSHVASRVLQQRRQGRVDGTAEQAHLRQIMDIRPADGLSSRVLHDSITISQPARRPSRPGYVPVAGTAENASTLYAGELEIRLGEGLVLATGRALTLSVREFELLAAMARRAGAIVTREELYAEVWGGELRAGDRSVDVYVSKLRGKLETAMPDRRFIHTHPGFGYRFQPQPARENRHRDGRGRRHARCRRRRRVSRRAFTKCSHRSRRRFVRLTQANPPAGRGLRVRADARGRRPAHITQQRERLSVIHNKIGALAGVAALALGLGACGSSSSSSSSSSTSSSSGGTISGAGSTFAAPVYQQWASSLSPLTVNYQAVGSGAGITSLGAKTVDFGASDPPLKPADFATLEKVGPVQQIPMFLGAITVSYNLPGVQTGLKLEGTTIADIYLGKIKTWNDAGDQGAEPGRVAAEHPDHGHPPLGLLRHDLRLHRLPGRGRPRIQEQGRRRQGRAVADRHGRQGQRRRRRRGAADRRAPSATSSRPTRCSTTSPTRRSRTRPATSSRRAWPRPAPPRPE